MVKRKSKISSEVEAYRIGDLLHSAAIHLLRKVRAQDRSAGIGPAQLSALSVLVFGGPRSLKELADAEQVRPPTMSRIVVGLERARRFVEQQCGAEARHRKPGEQPDESRFPRAVGADHGSAATGFDAKVHVAKNRRRTKALT